MFVFLDRETEAKFAQTNSLTLDEMWTDFAAAEAVHGCNGHFEWGEEEVAQSLALTRRGWCSEYELELAWETRKKPLLQGLPTGRV